MGGGFSIFHNNIRDYLFDLAWAASLSLEKDSEQIMDKNLLRPPYILRPSLQFGMATCFETELGYPLLLHILEELLEKQDKPSGI